MNNDDDIDEDYIINHMEYLKDITSTLGVPEMDRLCAPPYPRPLAEREEGRQGELRRCEARTRPGVTAQPWLSPGSSTAWACGFHAEYGLLTGMGQGSPPGWARNRLTLGSDKAL